MRYKIDTVLFDFDGTLIAIDIDFAKMRQDVVALGMEYGVSPESSLYVLESVEYIFHKLMLKDFDLAKDFKRRAEELIVNIEVEASSTAKAMPGAEETLSKLKSKGVKIGIVTRNCRSGVMRSLENTKLVYDLMLTRDDVEKVKPEPQHLLDAMRILKSEPEKTLMVGDHPMDIIAGKKAGAKTGAVLSLKTKEDFHESSPDFIFSSIGDILKLLQYTRAV